MEVFTCNVCLQVNQKETKYHVYRYFWGEVGRWG